MIEIKSQRVRDLLDIYRQNNIVINTEKLNFKGDLVVGKDVYNISKQFSKDGKEYIFGRVEARGSELSQTVLFEKVGDAYEQTSIKFDMLQDPCVTEIDSEIVLSGTEVYADETGRINNWRTVFYTNIFANPKKICQAPAKMKDARIYKLSDGRILIFSRPQGERGGKGTIGYAVYSSLDQVDETSFDTAPLLDKIFDVESWGGVNDLVDLGDGKVGVIGHIASMEEGDIRHYFGMTFVLDVDTSECSDIKIICERKDFAEGSYKRLRQPCCHF